MHGIPMSSEPSEGIRKSRLVQEKRNARSDRNGYCAMSWAKREVNDK